MKIKQLELFCKFQWSRLGAEGLLISLNFILKFSFHWFGSSSKLTANLSSFFLPRWEFERETKIINVKIHNTKKQYGSKILYNIFFNHKVFFRLWKILKAIVKNYEKTKMSKNLNYLFQVVSWLVPCEPQKTDYTLIKFSVVIKLKI